MKLHLTLDHGSDDRILDYLERAGHAVDIVEIGYPVLVRVTRVPIPCVIRGRLASLKPHTITLRFSPEPRITPASRGNTNPVKPTSPSSGEKARQP